MNSAAILLAAGASRRFGKASKLLAQIDGKPLVTYAAMTLRRLGCKHLIAVTVDGEVDNFLSGFTTVRPASEHPQMSDSLRAGIGQAQFSGADRALVALADMPFVQEAHFTRILDLTKPGSAIATKLENTGMPPACFPADMFDDLISATGDAGARSILNSLSDEQFVRADSHMLVDVDLPDDLVAIRSENFFARKIDKSFR